MVQPTMRIPMDRVRKTPTHSDHLTTRILMAQTRRTPPTHLDPQTMTTNMGPAERILMDLPPTRMTPMDQARKILPTPMDHPITMTIHTAQAREITTTRTLTPHRATPTPITRRTATLRPRVTETTVPQTRAIVPLVNCSRRLVVSLRVISSQRRGKRRDPMLVMTMNRCQCGCVHE